MVVARSRPVWVEELTRGDARAPNERFTILRYGPDWALISAIDAMTTTPTITTMTTTTSTLPMDRRAALRRAALRRRALGIPTTIVPLSAPLWAHEGRQTPAASSSARAQRVVGLPLRVVRRSRGPGPSRCGRGCFGPRASGLTVGGTGCRQLAGRLSPLHRGADGFGVHLVLVALGHIEDRAQDSGVEEVRHQAQIEELGVGSPVVMALFLDAGRRDVFDGG